MARSGRVRPDALGAERDPAQAYADSKACDVALASAWGRRLPGVASAAVDPGWVKTKLASPGAPGDPRQSADTLLYCATDADLDPRALLAGPAPDPDAAAPLRDPALQDALAGACDRLTGA